MGVTSPYDGLVDAHGKQAVVSQTITQDELQTITERQIAAVGPLIRSLQHGDEKLALDYGCGYGRFTNMLASMAGRAVGVDPSSALIHEGEPEVGVELLWADPLEFCRAAAAEGSTFDIVFLWTVMSQPSLDVEAVADALVSVLAPTGLLVIADHMPDEEPPGRWVRFRPASFYVDLFASRGVPLVMGTVVAETDDPVTVLVGRRPAAEQPVSEPPPPEDVAPEGVEPVADAPAA